MADEAFRTDDMTLVAVLTLNRYKYRIEVVQGQNGRKRANWLYSAEDHQSEAFKEILREFLANKIRVEPQVFVRTLSKVRGAMYTEIGPPERQGERELRAATSA
jgi:hypothetical protein